MFDDYETDPIPCPGCGYTNDGALDMHRKGVRRGPQDGDLQICVSCSQISVFTVYQGKLGLRTPTTAELDGYLGDPHVVHCIAALRSVRETGRPTP